MPDKPRTGKWSTGSNPDQVDPSPAWLANRTEPDDEGAARCEERNQLGIHGRIAADVYKNADYELRCRTCDDNFPLPEYRFGEFLAKGWPKCCGQTMSLNKLELRDAG